jgi:dolichyl-phosphate beta-glucosyltransferase
VSPRLTILIPAFNEAERIESTLTRIAAFAATIEGGAEILVVDDGSTDPTASVVLRSNAPHLRLLRMARNSGKGAALRAGVADSAGAEVLLCDADLSTPIEEYHRLRRELDDADLVLGSRGRPESRITLRQPWHREAMGRMFNRLVRWLVIDGFRDTQCGFKLLDGEAARALFASMRIDRFAFDVELVWLAVRRGYRVREVGVSWHDSPQSRVHPVRDSTRMLLDILRIRWRHRGEAHAKPGAGPAGAAPDSGPGNARGSRPTR